MDVCKELLIKKKWELTEILYAVMIVMGFPLAYTAVYYLIALMGLRILSFFVFVALAYGAYLLFLFLFREFEYTFVNGSLTIDVIYAKKKRKRLFDCESRDIVYLGKYDAGRYENKTFDKTIFAGESMKGENLMCAEIEDDDTNSRYLLLFSPTKEYLTHMKPFMKQTVIREVLRNME